LPAFFQSMGVAHGCTNPRRHWCMGGSPSFATAAFNNPCLPWWAMPRMRPARLSLRIGGWTNDAPLCGPTQAAELICLSGKRWVMISRGQRSLPSRQPWRYVQQRTWTPSEQLVIGLDNRASAPECDIAPDEIRSGWRFNAFTWVSRASIRTTARQSLYKRCQGCPEH